MVVRKGKSKRKSFIRKSNRLRQKIYRTKSKTRKNNKKRNTRKKNTKKNNKRNTKKNNTKKNTKKKRLIGGASTSSMGGTRDEGVLVQYFSEKGRWLPIGATFTRGGLYTSGSSYKVLGYLSERDSFLLERNNEKERSMKKVEIRYNFFLDEFYYVRLRYPGSAYDVWEPDKDNCSVSGVELGWGKKHRCRHCGMCVSDEHFKRKLLLDIFIKKEENKFIMGNNGPPDYNPRAEMVGVCDLCYSLPRFVVNWTKVGPGDGMDISIGPGLLVFPQTKHENNMVTCKFIDTTTRNELTYKFPEANLRPTRMFCGITINDLKAPTLEGKCVPIMNPDPGLRYTYDHVPVYAFCAMLGTTPHESGYQTYEQILDHLDGKNDKIESADKLIQFLFPIQQPSRYSEVPNVSSDEIVYLRNNRIFRRRLIRAKGIMLTFYLREDFEPRWGRHSKRITRILKCLSMFEGEASAREFLNKINGPDGIRERTTPLYPDPEGEGRDKYLYDETMEYWIQACYDHNFNELIQAAVYSLEGNTLPTEVRGLEPGPEPESAQVEGTAEQSAEDGSGSDDEKGLLSTRNCDGDHMCGEDEVCSCPKGKQCPPDNKVCVDMTELDNFI